MTGDYHRFFLQHVHSYTHTHTHTHTHRSLLFHPFGNAVTNTGSRSPNFKWLYLLSTFQVTNILELHKLCLIFPRICMMVTLIFIFKIWKQGHKMNSFAKITHLQFEPTWMILIIPGNEWKMSHLHYVLALPKLSDYEPTPNSWGQKHLPGIRLRVPVLLNLHLICECLILLHSPSLTQIISIPHTVSLLNWHPVHLLNEGLVESLSYSRYLINIYSMTQTNECYMAKPSYVEEGGAVEGKC